MNDSDDLDDLGRDESLDAPPSAKYLIALTLFAAIFFGALSLMSIGL